MHRDNQAHSASALAEAEAAGTREIQSIRLNIIIEQLVITLMKCVKQFRRGAKRYFAVAMATGNCRISFVIDIPLLPAGRGAISRSFKVTLTEIPTPVTKRTLVITDAAL